MKGEDDAFSIGSRPASVDYNYDTTQTLISSRTLLLNLNDSAISNGSIMSWNFCFFILDSEEMSDESIHVGIWRLINDTYSLVHGSLTELPMLQSYHGLDFACLKSSVPSGPIKVLEGDVVGAIVTAIPSPFSIVGSDEGSKIWMCPLPIDNHCANLTIIPSYGLYLEGGMYKACCDILMGYQCVM